MRLNFIFKIIALLILLPFFAVAQEVRNNPIEASLKILNYDPSANENPSVGTKLRFEIAIDPDVQLDPNDKSWSFEFASNDRWIYHNSLMIDSHSLEEDPNNPRKLYFTAIVSRKDNTIIEAIGVRQTSRDRVISTNQSSLISSSTILSPKEKPIWIYPPLPYGGWNKQLISTLIIIGLGILAVLILFLLKKYVWNKIRPQASIYEKSLKRLKKLDKTLLAQSSFEMKEWKLVSYELTSCIKECYSQRYKANLVELTDKELFQELDKLKLSSQNINIVNNIFTTLNEVRYGTQSLEKKTAKQLVDQGKVLIDQAKTESDLELKQKKKKKGGK